MSESKDLNLKSKIVQNEEKVLSFWNENAIFKKSLEGKSKEFVFMMDHRSPQEHRIMVIF